MSSEPKFRAGQPVFVRRDVGGDVRWRRGLVVNHDRWDKWGRPVYCVTYHREGGAYSVAECDMQSADLEQLTTV